MGNNQKETSFGVVSMGIYMLLDRASSLYLKHKEALRMGQLAKAQELELQKEQAQEEFFAELDKFRKAQ